MCKTDGLTSDHSRLKTYTFEEVKKHNNKDDKWLVINGNVYDITNFSKKHPGGARVISHYAGEDATDAWTAFHDRKDYVAKYMKSILIGTVSDLKQTAVVEDFRNLRETVEQMGLFKVDPWFFIGHIGHIILLEVIAYVVLSYYGSSWIPYLTALACLVTSQAQAGWSQHDYGHLSVFKSNYLNHLAHHFVIGQLKGVSSCWWNFRHFQHHAKPNIIRKDPDVNLPYVFLLGDKMPVVWGQKKKGFMPYNWQQDYFFLIGPPLLLPVYFHLEVLYFVFKRKRWQDALWMASFFARYFFCYAPILGFWGAFWFYMFIRFFESHWFVWVTQMSHISMEIDKDKEQDWFHLQLKSSCNANGSTFNDWFTGHLNYQIEHHLFPTMPRHNFSKCTPLVKSLCKKHGIEYQCKPLLQAFADVIGSLRKSGELWHEAYYGD